MSSDHDDNDYLDADATEERLDQTVKEYLWNEKTKKFEPYSFRIEDKLDE